MSLFFFSIPPLYIDDIFLHGRSKVDVYICMYVYIAFEIFDGLMGGLSLFKQWILSSLA